MRLAILLTALATTSTLLASPIQSIYPRSLAIASVRTASGTVYPLQRTESHNIRIITDKVNGEFVRPVGYSVSSGWVCKFYR